MLGDDKEDKDRGRKLIKVEFSSLAPFIHI